MIFQKRQCSLEGPVVCIYQLSTENISTNYNTNEINDTQSKLAQGKESVEEI